MAKRKMGNVNLFLLVPVIIYGGMIKYIVDLENSQLCPCSATKNRTDLKNLLIMWVCLLLGSLLLQVLVKDKNMKEKFCKWINMSCICVS